MDTITTVSQAPSEPVTTVVSNAVPNEHPVQTYEKKKVIFRAYQVVWYILGVVEVLLLFRVGLKVLAANSYSSFAQLIYSISDPLALPFYGLFRVSSTSQGSLFEWSTLVAMAVYALLAYGVVSLLKLVKPVTPQEVVDKV